MTWLILALLVIGGLSQAVVAPAADEGSSDSGAPDSGAPDSGATTTPTTAAEKAFAGLKARQEGQEPTEEPAKKAEADGTKPEDTKGAEGDAKADVVADPLKPDASTPEAKTDPAAETKGEETKDSSVPELLALKELGKDLSDEAKVKFDAGVDAVVAKLTEREAGVTALETELNGYLGDKEALPRLQTMSQWGKLLEDKEMVAFAYHQLGDALAQHHGIPREDLGKATGQLPIPTEVKTALDGVLTEEFGNADLDSSEGWEDAGYGSEGEFLAEKRSFARTQRRMIMQGWQGARSTAKVETPAATPAKAEEPALPNVAGIAPAIIAEIAQTCKGFVATSEMLAQALKAYPQHLNDPAEAVRAKYSKEIAAHYADTSKAASPEVPAGAPAGSASQGVVIPPIGERTATDVAKANSWKERGLLG